MDALEEAEYQEIAAGTRNEARRALHGLLYDSDKWLRKQTAESILNHSARIEANARGSNVTVVFGNLPTPALPESAE